jgi:formylglycine-generating enzyme required for sulfatase activity
MYVFTPTADYEYYEYYEDDVVASVEESKLAEEALAKRARVEVVREKAFRGEVPAPPRAGIQTWADIPFVNVPAGKFLMGSRRDNKLAHDNEKEQHTVDIAQDYWVSRFPVTNTQFLKFIDATKYQTIAEKEGGWTGSDYKKGFDWRHPLGSEDYYEEKLNHPVVQINWYDAQKFCEWLNRIKDVNLPKGYVFRLPTEAEWEKSARGEYGNEWPWGNEYDANKCNSYKDEKSGTISCGTYSPDGDSPYGVADMAGNVWEWTQSLWGSNLSTPEYMYPYNPKDGREEIKAGVNVYRVLRGGSFTVNGNTCRCAFRGLNLPDARRYQFGFRIVVAPILNF